MSAVTKKDLADIKKKWAKAIVSRDLDTILGLYAQNAVLKPTLSNEIRSGISKIRPYFKGSESTGETGFLNNGIHSIEWKDSEIRQINGLLMETGQYVFSTDTEIIEADYTFVIQKESDTAKIITHHSSLTYSK